MSEEIKDRKTTIAEIQLWNYECSVFNALWYENQTKYLVDAYEKITGDIIPPPPNSGIDGDETIREESTNIIPTDRRRAEQQQAEPEVSTTFDIPSFTTRIIAEFIDFLIVFAIKIFVTNFLLLYVFNIKLARSAFSFSYTFDELQLELLNLESGLMQEDNLMQELMEIVLIGGVHKLAVIFLEMWFLAGRRDNLGGCTPGKRIMGIRVIGCASADSLGPEEALVTGCRNLGYSRSLIRSVIKNMAMTFFFPLVFTVMMYNNRTAYDVVSHSLVVYHPNRGPNRDNANRE